jgi:hypothetical protein
MAATPHSGEAGIVAIARARVNRHTPTPTAAEPHCFANFYCFYRDMANTPNVLPELEKSGENH